MTALAPAPMFLSKARMWLTNNLAGLMALCKNIKWPIRTCNLFFEIIFFRKMKLAESYGRLPPSFGAVIRGLQWNPCKGWPENGPKIEPYEISVLK
jgi:hypothetical protein